MVAGDDKVWLRETTKEDKKEERREDLFQKRKLRIAKDKEALLKSKASTSKPVIVNAEDNQVEDNAETETFKFIQD